MESAEFFCECHDPACGARVVVPLDEYESVREESTRFLHAAGHVESDFERVVARRPKYAIVEKFGRTLATSSGVSIPEPSSATKPRRRADGNVP